MNRKTEIDPKAAWESMLRAVFSLIRTFERELQEAEDLPLAWYDVLLQLDESPEGRLRMQALADSVVLSRSGLTRLIDRMEKAGLVQREPSTEDRRGHYALLTEEGRAVLLRARPVHHRGIYDHFTSHLDEADLKALNAVTEKIRNGNQ